MPLTHQQRIELGLDLPPAASQAHGAPLSGEFMPGGTGPGTLQAMAFNPRPATYTPNLKLVLSDNEKATAPKIRGLVNELLAGNVEKANLALAQLFEANPKEALKLYLELAEFSLPKLKAVAVAVDDRSDSPKAMSFAQLQAALAG